MTHKFRFTIIKAKKKKITSFLFIFCLLTCQFLHSQSSLLDNDSHQTYHKAMVFFQTQNYYAAQELFHSFIEKNTPVAEKPYQILISNAKFYSAICAIELGQPSAEKLLLDYIEFEEASPTKLSAYFYLGKLMNEKRNFKEAIVYFKQTQTDDLNRNERDELKFQLGYAHFNLKELNEAYPLFKQIIEVENKYYYPANYYYGYISYTKSKWDDALKSFERIKSSKIYEKVVPYYIAQIYFQKKQYQQLVDYLEPMIHDNQVKYQEELKLTLGQAYFELKNYAKASEYIAVYTKNNKARKEEIFQLGYSYYKIENFELSITQLKTLDNLTDSIGQNALYVLGKSFLELKRKPEAAAAFQKAARINIDPLIQEESLFNQAKLSAELGNDKTAIDLLQAFVQNYPTSIHANEAKEILSYVLLSTKNYKDALQIIESIKSPTAKVKKAYQQVAFYRANELLNDKKYNEAIQLFLVSLKNPISDNLKAQSYFGLGESFFQLEDYKSSIKYFSQFLQDFKSVEGAFRFDKLINAQYALGYAHFKLSKYVESVDFFSKSIQQIKSHPSETGNLLYADALLRNGDSYFMLKNYEVAIKNYQSVVDASAPGSDYALMQKATIQGIQNKYEDKIRTLQYLQNSNPKSVYVDDAIYYIGEAYFLMNKSQTALQNFTQLFSKYPQSPFVSKSFLKSGLIYYNQDDVKKSVESYRWVIENYPQSNDAQEALAALREMSINEGNPDIYMNIVNENRTINVSLSEKDSINYLSAEAVFAKGDCENAIPKFTNYLTSFPNGFFLLRAYFYRSECWFKTKKFTDAVNGYEYVANAGQNIFREKSILKAAEINYYELKSYERSKLYYQLLLENASTAENVFAARLGLMRSHFYLNQVNEIESDALYVLQSKEAAPEQVTEAEFYLAKFHELKNNSKNAQLYFSKVAEKSTTVIGAESKYKLAMLAFTNNQLTESEKLCFATIKDYNSYEYWVVKAYILLSDIYVKQNNNFQAKATLESIIDNTSFEELKSIAQNKINLILENEKKTTSLQSDGMDLENPLDTIQLN